MAVMTATRDSGLDERRASRQIWRRLSRVCTALVVAAASFGFLGSAATPAAAGSFPTYLDKNLGSVMNPLKIVNLYMDTNWDANNPTMSMQRIDDFTASMYSSGYFNGLGQYGVTPGSFLGSFQADPGCVSGGTTPVSVDYFAINGFVFCEKHTFNIAPQFDQSVIYMVYTSASTLWSGGCPGWGGFHALTLPSIIPPDSPQFFGFVFDASACGDATLADATLTGSHEAVEAATDSTPLFGWIDNNDYVSTITGGVSIFSAGEAADLCESGVGSPVTPLPSPDHVLMPGSLQSYDVAYYWSNAAGACIPAPLTITASSSTVTYGAATPTITPIYSGLINGDTAPATPPSCGATPALKNGNPVAGTYTTFCFGASDPKYMIAYVTGTLTVNPSTLTVTASSPTITYGTATPTIAPIYSGLVNGDTAPAVPPTCGVSPTFRNGNPVVGTYSTSCSGASDPNYTIGYVGGILTVNAALLTITATDGTMIYGGSPPTINPIYSGFVNGDGPTALTTAPTCSTSATSSSPVSGSPYSSSCSGAASPNYAIGYVNGSVIVSPAPLTVTADDQSRLVNLPNPALTATITGFVNGETLSTSGVTGTAACTTTATTSSPAGLYPITCATGTLAASNYAFTNFVPGTLTIITAQQATQNLIATIDGMGLPMGLQTSLEATLGQIVNQINAGKITPVCNKLDAFISKVNVDLAGGKLTAAQAAQLLLQASLIEASLGCGTTGSHP
jgi:hypothetical protein